MATITVPVTSRKAWGANPLITPASQIRIPVDEVWLHHSGGQQFGAAGVRSLQRFALQNTRDHYIDLEYTFMIDRLSCEIFESRGPGRDSAATLGHNSHSAAICVMGNFENDDPSPQLVEVIARLVVMGFQQRWWSKPALTGGHRDSGFATACPGHKLEAKIPAINARANQLSRSAPEVKVVVQPRFHKVAIDELTVPSVGSWTLFDDGAIHIHTGKNQGAPRDHMAGSKSPFFAGRNPARIVAPGTHVDRAHEPGKDETKRVYDYVVIATSGERYGFPVGGK